MTIAALNAEPPPGDDHLYTIAAAVNGNGRYANTRDQKYGDIRVVIAPGTMEEIEFEWNAAKEALPYPFMKDACREGMNHALQRYPKRLVRLRITVVDGSYHYVDTGSAAVSISVDGSPPRRCTRSCAGVRSAGWKMLHWLYTPAAMALPPSATAINKLLAIPWEPVAKQRAADAKRDLEESLEDRKLADKDGEKAGLKWDFGLKLNNVKASVDLDSPPALTKASASAFTLEVPSGSWGFSISGDVKGRASVKAAGNKIFSWSPGLHFGLRIKNFKVVTNVTLDMTRPNRPKIKTSSVQPSLEIVGGGFLPVDIPISFTVSPEPGKIVMRGKMTAIDLKEEFGALDAKLTADLVVSIFERGEIDLVVPEPEPFDVDTEIPVGDNFQTLKIEFNGQLKLSLDRIGKVTIPFAGFDISIPFPKSEGLGEVFTLLDNDLPRRWGDEIPAPYSADVPDPGALTTCVPDIEAAAEKHMPHGAAFSFEYSAGAPRTTPAPRGRLEGGYSYRGEEDSAIWTGHYLAAESLRYAVTQDPAALARVKATLEGVKKLFWVTTDAVGTTTGSQTAIEPVLEPAGRRSSTARAGILSRTAKPDSDSRGFAKTGDKKKSGPLENRPFFYVKPENGWQVSQHGRPGMKYATFASVPPDQRVNAKPIGPVWYGWGCGDNHPVSRDQYVGTMMGLALAWKLVADAEVRSTAGRLIEDVLDFLIDNKWTVPLPPDWRIQTDFLGDIPKQLAFLRIGKTVAPAKYGNAYDEVASAAELAWLAPWFSSFDPVLQYYKFNLSHAAFITAFMLEDDAAQRDRWYSSYLRLWGPVAHHRNAYFDLIRIIAEPPARRTDLRRSPSQSNPAVTLENEVTLVLGEWVRRWTLIKGQHGGPLHLVGDAAHQLQLWPDKFGKFNLLDGRTFCLAKYALPVDGRSGSDKDFMWQRDPFRVSVPSAGCKRSPKPDTEQILKRTGKGSRRESPGIDYLLAYWLAVYVRVLPGSIAPPPS